MLLSILRARMATPRGKKRARLEEEEGGSEEQEVDLRLGKSLSKFMGGRRYCKQSELTHEVLLNYVKSTKEITEVELIKVSVQGLCGLTFDVLMDTEQRQVRILKAAIQQEQGITSFSQQLFLLAKSGKVEEAGERPLDNGDDVAGDCSMLLCIQTQQGLLSLLFISKCGFNLFSLFRV